MRSIAIVFFFLMMSLFGYSQNVRFALQLGGAVPLGDLARNDSDPENGGFAKTGFNMSFVGERVLKNHFVTGINLGYSMFGIDQDALRTFINPSNPELVKVETQAFQNFNVQFRVGYDLNFDSGNFHITPSVDLGLGVFSSAYYAIQNNGGDTHLRSGNSAVSVLITPGVDVSYMINPFMGIKLYGSYQVANYAVDEEFQIVGGNPGQNMEERKNYKYNSLCLGIGLNVML
ncbi:MAG: hypothetical protein ACI85Q_002140 [Salibacteraceae bacterium]|jgi:hypothetical protein